jgi:hypothetical protein
MPTLPQGMLPAPGGFRRHGSGLSVQSTTPRVRIPTTADVGGLGRIPTSRAIGRPDLTPIGEGMIAYGTAVGRAGAIIGKSISQMGSAFSQAAGGSGSAGFGGGGQAYDTQLAVNEFLWNQRLAMMEGVQGLDPTTMNWRGFADNFTTNFDPGARAVLAGVPEKYKAAADKALFAGYQSLYTEAYNKELEAQGTWITHSIGRVTNNLVSLNLGTIGQMSTQDKVWDQYLGHLQDLLDDGTITLPQFNQMKDEGGTVLSRAFADNSSAPELAQIWNQKIAPVTAEGLITSNVPFRGGAYQRNGKWRIGFGSRQTPWVDKPGMRPTAQGDRITQDEALAVLRKDLDAERGRLAKKFDKAWKGLPQSTKEVLIAVSYENDGELPKGIVAAAKDGTEGLANAFLEAAGRAKDTTRKQYLVTMANTLKASGYPDVAPSAGDPTMPVFQNVIGHLESGNNYTRLGKVVVSGFYKGDRGYGRYQVMGKNIPSWTKAALGRSLTPEQFLNDAEAQDRTFIHRFGGYLSKYGTPQDAASMWFTGQPFSIGKSRTDPTMDNMSGNQYVNNFNKQLVKEMANPTRPTEGLYTLPGAWQHADAQTWQIVKAKIDAAEKLKIDGQNIDWAEQFLTQAGGNESPNSLELYDQALIFAREAEESGELPSEHLNDVEKILRDRREDLKKQLDQETKEKMQRLHRLMVEAETREERNEAFRNNEADIPQEDYDKFLKLRDEGVPTRSWPEVIAELNKKAYSPDPEQVEAFIAEDLTVKPGLVGDELAHFQQLQKDLRERVQADPTGRFDTMVNDRLKAMDIDPTKSAANMKAAIVIRALAIEAWNDWKRENPGRTPSRSDMVEILDPIFTEDRIYSPNAIQRLWNSWFGTRAGEEVTSLKDVLQEYTVESTKYVTVDGKDISGDMLIRMADRYLGGIEGENLGLDNDIAGFMEFLTVLPDDAEVRKDMGLKLRGEGASTAPAELPRGYPDLNITPEEVPPLDREKLEEQERQLRKYLEDKSLGNAG